MTSIAYRSKSSAKVGFLADGAAQVSAATHDLGTGMWTVLAIVGAECLGLPLERIRPVLGDSALPAAPISWGSLSTASVSPAVQRAADSAKKKLIQFAVSDKKSPFGGMKPEEVSYENGQLVGGGKTADFGSVLNAMGRSSIEATESAEAGEEKTKYAFHSFGAQFCELRVNQWTNEVRVSRITSVMDAGQVAVTGRQ
ncbi:MAG TPA: molybdopterin cofactor-binding domain-containing protein [Chthoniobacterales bacterium]|nr:molybdopterin cofactor-binding domain-containing protein [Chthoniobacterales bacterium]